jgi:hypothetical protein
MWKNLVRLKIYSRNGQRLKNGTVPLTFWAGHGKKRNRQHYFKTTKISKLCVKKLGKTTVIFFYFRRRGQFLKNRYGTVKFVGGTWSQT